MLEQKKTIKDGVQNEWDLVLLTGGYENTSFFEAFSGRLIIVQDLEQIRAHGPTMQHPTDSSGVVCESKMQKEGWKKMIPFSHFAPTGEGHGQIFAFQCSCDAD